MRKHHGLGLCKNVMDGMSRKLRPLRFRSVDDLLQGMIGDTEMSVLIYDACTLRRMAFITSVEVSLELLLILIM